MNVRKFKTDPSLLLEQGKSILESSSKSRFYFRVLAVTMALSDWKISQIAEILKVSRMSISTWVKTADEKGFDALKTQKHEGRPSKLTAEQREEIDRVLQSDPNQYGYKIWDGPNLSAYIKSSYGIELSVRQCQRLFHSLGFSLIRPRPYPTKGYENTEERKAFKKTNRSRDR